MSRPDAWTLHRPSGSDRLCLGGLRFGMTREEAAAVATAYGPVERVEDHDSRTQGMALGLEGIEQFGFSAEDLAIARQALMDVADQTQNWLTEYRALGDPTLDYDAGRLARVAMDHHCAALRLPGLPIFGSDIPALLDALQAMDGGRALREGDTVWFPALAVTLMGFYGERLDGSIGVLDDSADPRIRHLILEPYGTVSDAPEPVPVVF